MHKGKKTLKYVLAVGLVFCTISQAHAWIGMNGTGDNGIRHNGVRQNGVKQNGIKQNGVVDSGARLVIEAIELPAAR